MEGLQTGIEYTRIGNRIYHSFRTWENFHYQQKGLGYPTSIVEKIGLSLRYFDLFPALLKLQAFYQRAGAIELTDVFPGEKEKISGWHC